MKPLLDAHRDKLKPEVIWNIEKGLALSADDVVKAEHQRAAMFQRTLDFFRRLRPAAHARHHRLAIPGRAALR
jgi:hypothetical protein